ncbi:RluA family pseudouridine synthase [uncultured Treponema sp.]|uniref:RluA family pseudouridine synthase n=1 Tax=uncultured Treponema sp. TaxID=162155 RepID=UPI0025D92F2B|nr:RluA family pseudouridine synthase [uncultured Treponema sp.]
MFPPFPEEKAATILEKVLSALKNGQLSLVQAARPSEERKNQGVMLGVLVCKDKEGNEVALVTNSGNARKLKTENGKVKVENGKWKTENGKRKTESGKLNVGEDFSSEERDFFSGGENFSSEARDSQVSSSNFQLSSFNFHLSASNFQLSSFNFQLVPPIVSAEEIDEALSQNDGEIHAITEKLKREKGKRKAGSVLSHHERNDEDPKEGHDECGSSSESLEELKERRERLCRESLEKVHALYRFHCIDGKVRTLKEICGTYNHGKLPPTGTGDCCAPKLLDYAFSHDLIPISLAETEYTETSGNDCSTAEGVPLAVWSDSGSAESVTAKPDRPTPNSSLLTPPCDERCGILLPAMLGLRILYRDEAICVVNKQSGLLSVPGRGEDKQDCVESRFRRLFGDAVEILQPAVHRLDMETSGIMILAFTKEAHRELNRQFEAKEVQKEYVSLLDGILPKMGIPTHGQMELFFRLDVDNRPHQIWDAEKGKSAITEWEILGVERYHAPDGTTRNASRVLFKPHTGRTHQLRLASSDSHGFGCPIIGDTLYGHCEEGERLMLHAQKIEFTHPTTGRTMTIECPPEF